MVTSIEQALAQLRQVGPSSGLIPIPGGTQEQQHTFDVTFFGERPENSLQARVVASTVVKAMIAAKEALSNSPDLNLCNTGVTAERINLAAEAQQNAAVSAFVDQQQDAVTAFRSAGYEPIIGRDWYRHPDTQIYAAVDSYMLTPGNRFAGLYAHRIDDNGKDVYQPLVLIPWYGDGAAADQQIALLFGALAVFA